MGDISREKQTMPTILKGGGSDGEEYNAGISPLDEQLVADILNNGGTDAELTVGTSAVELKVGASKKANRKYVIFVPLDSGIKFGFSSSTQNIPVFKHQMIMMPVGEDTEVWFIATSSGKTVAIGEL